MTLMLSLCTVTASANASMWPDVIIKLDQPYEGDYIVVVLSDRNAFFPYNERYSDEDDAADSYTANETAALNKIRSVGDEDGYQYIAYFDPYHRENGDTSLIYAYDTLKIALYFPDTDTLVKTDILKKDSYIEVFKLTLDKQRIADIQTAQYNQTTLSEGEYHPAVITEKPIVSMYMIKLFFICLAVNLAVETLIALAFGYRKWRHIVTIMVTNVVTLLMLTVSVQLINPPVAGGLLSFPFAYFEIAVAAVEGTVYAILFRRFEYREKYRPWLAVIYAVAANLVTYVIGAFFYILPC